MLTTDVSEYIPEILKRITDDAGTALINKLNTYIEDWKNESYQLSWLIQPERCPAEFLELLDQYLEAGFEGDDTEAQKRFKVFYAVQRHKLRTSFDDDVKLIIDNISGKDSAIWKYAEDDAWVLCGDGSTGGTTYRSTFGTDNIDGSLGIHLESDGTEPDIAGVVLVDVGWVVGDMPVTAKLAEMVVELEKHVPAYYRVFLGYEGVSGKFVYLQEV